MNLGLIPWGALCRWHLLVHHVVQPQSQQPRDVKGRRFPSSASNALSPPQLSSLPYFSVLLVAEAFLHLLCLSICLSESACLFVCIPALPLYCYFYLSVSGYVTVSATLHPSLPLPLPLPHTHPRSAVASSDPCHAMRPFVSYLIFNNNDDNNNDISAGLPSSIDGRTSTAAFRGGVRLPFPRPVTVGCTSRLKWMIH